ncbi:MAG: CidA/LrgA family protein [Lachnospiraceae bacterium]|nr:CidA/LrgA family protein [Lachnospiraceae bacterium]
MKYLKQFGIILAISFAGELLNKILPLPIPASIYGLVILFALLHFGILKVDHVKETSTFLIEIMPLMFIPAAVGLLESWGIIKYNVVPYIVMTVVSTIVVMAVSGIVTQLVSKSGCKAERREQAQ